MTPATVDSAVRLRYVLRAIRDAAMQQPESWLRGYVLGITTRLDADGLLDEPEDDDASG